MQLHAQTVAVTKDPNTSVSAHCWVSPNSAVLAADDKFLYEVNLRADPFKAVPLIAKPLSAPVLSIAALPLQAVLGKSKASGTARAYQSLLALGLGDGTLQLLKFRVTEDSSSLAPRSVKILGSKKTNKSITAPLTALCWQSDASSLIAGAEDGTIIVFSPTGNPRASFPQLRGSTIHALAVGSESMVFAAASSGLFSVQLQASAEAAPLSSSACACVAWSCDRSAAVAGHDDGKVRMIGNGGEALWTAPDVASEGVTTVAATPSGGFALCGSQLGRVALLALNSGVRLAEHRFEHGAVHSLSFCPGGTSALATFLCGTAAVLTVCGQRTAYGLAEFHLNAPNNLQVWDCSAQPFTREELQTPGPIAHVATGFGHAVFLSRTHVFVSECPAGGRFGAAVALRMGTTSSQPLTGSMLVDTGPTLQAPPLFVSLGPEAFAVGDEAGIIHVLTYGLRVAGRFRHPAPPSRRAVALGTSHMAFVDSKNTSSVVVTTTSGKPVAEGKLSHIRPIRCVRIASMRDEPLLVVHDTADEVWATKLPLPGAGALAPFQRVFVPPVSDIAFVERSRALVLLTADALMLHALPRAQGIDSGLEEAPLFRVPSVTVPAQACALVCAHPQVGSAAPAALLETSPCSTLFARLPQAALRALTAPNAEQLLRVCRAHPSRPLWALAALRGVEMKALSVLKAAYSALALVPRVQAVMEAQALPSAYERDCYVTALAGDVEKALAMLTREGHHRTAVTICLAMFLDQRAREVAAQSGDPELVSLVEADQA
eukprot:gnl/Chilomastix_cuspidata/2395.p2 GENE.gnl/Chilomastix_cuspidata/2395~~gnl/Chilomastix_cuspidata/2395.p2  ORF type:complete len:773 (-),score=319.14 gnl/Chilomastix_cuspidata/2395:244-2562(-)